MATCTDSFGDEWTESDFDDHVPAAYRRQLARHPNPDDPEYPHIEDSDELTEDPDVESVTI